MGDIRDQNHAEPAPLPDHDLARDILVKWLSRADWLEHELERRHDVEGVLRVRDDIREVEHSIYCLRVAPPMERVCDRCGKGFPLHDLHCVPSGRGATSRCGNECTVVCTDCVGADS